MTEKTYTNKLRVRSCGLLLEKDKLLLVELFSPITKQWTWMPPGGGVEFGETLKETLDREFREETGLRIAIQQRIHIHELINPPIHAIEFYFLVNRKDGELVLGSDPEMKEGKQIIRNIGFFTKEQIQNMKIAPPFLKEKFWESIQD